MPNTIITQKELLCINRMNLYLHDFRAVAFSRGKGFTPVRWHIPDKPGNVAVKLEAYMLSPLIYRTVPLSEGILINGIAGSVVDNYEWDIVPDIVA